MFMRPLPVVLVVSGVTVVHRDDRRAAWCENDRVVLATGLVRVDDDVFN